MKRDTDVASAFEVPKKNVQQQKKQKKASVPATIPTIFIRDSVEWIEFCYEIKNASVPFEIRTDIDNIDVDDLDPDWRTLNCVYAGANMPEDDYKGNRYNYESSVNAIGWKLCHVNPSLCGKKGLIQRAVDSFRNRFTDLRSRRVVRQEKFLNGSLRQRATPRTEDPKPHSHIDSFSSSSATPMYKNPVELNTPSVTPYTQDYPELDTPYQQQTPQSLMLLSSINNQHHHQTPALTNSFSVPYAPLTPRPDSLIGRHLVNKLRHPKTLTVETMVSAKSFRLRVHVDIERVDTILSNSPMISGAGTMVGGIDAASFSSERSSTSNANNSNSSEDGKENIVRFASSYAFRRGNYFQNRIKESGLSALYEYVLPDGSVGVDFDGLKTRYEHEAFMNEISWRIAVLNRTVPADVSNLDQFSPTTELPASILLQLQALASSQKDQNLPTAHAVEDQQLSSTILTINPADYTKPTHINLDSAHDCWIEISHLPDPLSAISKQLPTFNTLFDLHPTTEKNSVVMRGMEVPAHRWYCSYGATPSYNDSYSKNHMYSCLNCPESTTSPEIPFEFQPYMDAINNGRPDELKYNQLVVNWYENGMDYTPNHVDLGKGLVDDDIVTLTLLCETESKDPLRVFRMKPILWKQQQAAEEKEGSVDGSLSRVQVDILTSHGSVIKMGGQVQNYYRHGIPKMMECDARRISLSFRRFL
ncbi:UNVERIFIED_CONTAM: hypothetical protein HDU68_008437 [Siphonaria sp. JEL0065]|nr:hypothetical protein HDU68_008437 [Siphonaria sp. JEL0065]